MTRFFLSTRSFNVKTNFFSAFVSTSLCAAAIFAALSVKPAFAQTPARTDKIMTLAELRACMKLEQSNKKTAAEILQEQETFKRDQDAVKADQAEVGKASDDVRARSALLAAERDAISALSSALSEKAQTTKTDAEKADFEAERAKLVERNRQYEQNAENFNATQQALQDRVSILNQRVDAINQRNKTINDRVAPQQKQVTMWRDQCGNRRFREEDEIEIKKEIAAGR